MRNLWDDQQPLYHGLQTVVGHCSQALGSKKWIMLTTWYWSTKLFLNAYIYIYIHLFIYIISEYCPSVDVGLYILYLMPRVGWIMLVHYPYWFTSPLWGKLTGKKHCWPSKKTLVARRYHPRKLDICFFFMNIYEYTMCALKKKYLYQGLVSQKKSPPKSPSG